MTPTIVAHQGGWDEILLVLVPIVLFALLLVVANRRADAIESGRRADERPGDAGDAEGRSDDRPR